MTKLQEKKKKKVVRNLVVCINGFVSNPDFLKNNFGNLLYIFCSCSSYGAFASKFQLTGFSSSNRKLINGKKKILYRKRRNWNVIIRERRDGWVCTKIKFPVALSSKHDGVSIVLASTEQADVYSCYCHKCGSLSETRNQSTIQDRTAETDSLTQNDFCP